MNKKQVFSFVTFMFVLIPCLFAFVGCEKDAPEKHDIFVRDVEHGIVVVSKTEAVKGEEIIVTATPDFGYELAVLTFNGKVIENNKFTMPDEDVEIDALFKIYTTEEIALKTGAWVYSAYFNDDGDDTTLYSNMYQVVIIEQGNIAKFISSDTNFEGYIELPFNKNGNNISFAYDEYQAGGVMIDENIFVIKFESETYSYYNVFTYQEKVELQFASYVMTLTPTNSIEVNVLSASELTITTTNGEQIETINATYVIYGNRIVMKSGNDTLLAIISDVQDSGFKIKYLCEYNEETRYHLELEFGFFTKQISS